MMTEGHSINNGQIKAFSVADYVVFSLILAISAGTGLFYAIKNRDNVNSAEYLLAERRMHVFSVAMSMLLTFVSALSVLTTPAEIQSYTAMFCWFC